MNSLEAKEVLLEDAKKIRQIIINQPNALCISKCKAFEEVIDTQLYGFSCKIDFAIKIGIITSSEGKEMLMELENELDQIYENILGEDN